MRLDSQRRIPALLGFGLALAAAMLWRRAADRRRRAIEQRTVARLRAPDRG